MLVNEKPATEVAVNEILTRERLPATSTSLPRLARLGDLLVEWEADAIAAHAARVDGAARGPVTSFVPLDQELGGALAVGLHHLHGAPGAGKTALALQIAASCGAPALFVTTEMGPLELLRRHTARVTGTYLGRFKSGELPPAESVALARRAVAAAPRLVIADTTQAFATPTWLREACRLARGEAEHLLIVVDSVHSWSDAAPGDIAEYDRLNAALAALRALAHELACPILAVAERNRASMASGGLSAAAGSRRFEYSGETVLDLGREKETPPDAAGEVVVTLTVAKNRNGPAGRKFSLRFHGALQRFREG
jgi:replicative DNA helicase